MSSSPEKSSTPQPVAAASIWRQLSGSEKMRRIAPLALAWICILLPAVLTARLIHLNAVSIPFLDDFMFTPFLEKARAGTLTLDDFFVVQMEHRLAWPRVIILLMHKLAPGNYVAQNWVTYGFIAWTVLNIGILLRRTGRPFAQWWPVWALCSLAFFSPVQYQIILWPMMFQVVTPAWALTCTLVTLSSRLPWWMKWILSVFFALTATLSIASGLLLWILLIPIIMWTQWLPQRASRFAFLGLWLAAFAVTTLLYFHDLKNGTDPQFAYKAGHGEMTMGKGISNFLRDPQMAIAFTLRFAGANLARGTSIPMLTAALAWGIVLVALWMAAAVLLIRQRRCPGLLGTWIPWLMLGGYTIGTGFLVSLGRAWASKAGDNSLQARYVCHAIPLTASLLVLGWLALSHFTQAKPVQALRCRIAAGAAVILLLGMQFVEWSHGAVMMETWASSRLRAAANTAFFKIQDRPHLLNEACELCPNIVYAQKLDDMGLLPHPMLKDTRLDNFSRIRDPVSSNTAQFRELRLMINDREPRYTMLAEGYASLPRHGRVPDALLFVYREKDNTRHIFHVAQILEPPLFLRDSLGRDLRFLFVHDKEPGRSLTRFQVEIPFAALPAEMEEAKVELWLLDYRRWAVHQVDGEFRVSAKTRKIINLNSSKAPKKPAARPPSNEEDEAETAPPP